MGMVGWVICGQQPRPVSPLLKGLISWNASREEGAGFGLSDEERHRRFVVASRRREIFQMLPWPCRREREQAERAARLKEYREAEWMQASSEGSSAGAPPAVTFQSMPCMVHCSLVLIIGVGAVCMLRASAASH
jgi:hypothetical protein